MSRLKASVEGKAVKFIRFAERQAAYLKQSRVSRRLSVIIGVSIVVQKGVLFKKANQGGTAELAFRP